MKHHSDHDKSPHEYYIRTGKKENYSDESVMSFLLQFSAVAVRHESNPLSFGSQLSRSPACTCTQIELKDTSIKSVSMVSLLLEALILSVYTIVVIIPLVPSQALPWLSQWTVFVS